MHEPLKFVHEMHNIGLLCRYRSSQRRTMVHSNRQLRAGGEAIYDAV